MEDLEFLKELTNLPGGSGDEDLVRKALKKCISKVTTPQVDALGNVYGEVGFGPKVLAVGHMDEIAYKVESIKCDGSLSVHNVGYVFPWSPLSQIYNVNTKNGQIKGVMGCDPDQKMFKGEHTEFPKVEDLRLYVGAHSKQEAEKLGIEIGDSVTFENHFTLLNNKEIVSKAWDNRIGCAISVRALEDLASKDLHVTYFGGGSVQEEVGLRGAKALVKHIKPDIAFALDTAPSNNEEGSTIGKGPILFVMDSYSIPHKKLLEFVKQVAKDNAIPYQLCLLRRGGSDASAFQNETEGVPVLTIGVPVKFIHSPISTIAYEDYLNTLKLFEKVLLALNEDEIKKIKAFDE